MIQSNIRGGKKKATLFIPSYERVKKFEAIGKSKRRRKIKILSKYSRDKYQSATVFAETALALTYKTTMAIILQRANWISMI